MGRVEVFVSTYVGGAFEIPISGSKYYFHIYLCRNTLQDFALQDNALLQGAQKSDLSMSGLF